MKKFNLIIFLLFLILTNFNIKLYAQQPDVKIVGGSPANIEDYPYQVAIFSVDENGEINEFMCGGSIIDRYWIITAAHCVAEKAHKKQRIVAAFSRISEIENAAVYEISDYILHPEYDGENVENDIALLRLAYPIDTSNIASKVIRILTPEEEQQGLIAPGVMATITGWGTTEYMGEQPDQLQVGFLPIISIETANQWFSETAPGSNTVTESMLPAGYEQGGVSGCHGDSGGPLAVKDATDTYVLAGITSWGNVCGAPKQPAIYTRVPYFYDWIMNNSKINQEFMPTKDNFIELAKIDVKNKVYACGDVPEIGEYLVVNTGRNDLAMFEVTIKIGNNPQNITKVINKTVVIDNPLPTGGSKRFPIHLEGNFDYGMYYVEVMVSKPNAENVALEKYTENTYFELAKPDILKLSINFGNIMAVGCVIMDMNTMQMAYQKDFNMTASGKKIEEEICLGEGNYYFMMSGMGDYDFKLSIVHNDTTYDLLWNEQQSFFHFTAFSIPFEPNYDGAITTQHTSGDKLQVCDLNDVSDLLGIMISNNGSLPLKNIKYKITYNDSPDTEIKTIASSLFAGISNQINLNTDKLRIGYNKIKVEIISYDNFEKDVDIENNSVEIHFEVVQYPKFATLTINGVDEYWQYGWEIRNEQDEIVMSRNMQSPFTVDYDLCLEEGCYYFVPQNPSDYGLDIDTVAVIKDINGNVLLVVTGDEFLSENYFEFCNYITSVEEPAFADDLKLFPNPATNAINLSFHSNINSPVNISVVNTLGNKIYTYKINARMGINHHSIDLNNMPTGVYSLQIEMNNKVISRKFVVVK